MRIFKIFPLFVSFIVLVSFSNSFAQTYGKIFTMSEANQIYGSVLKSISIPTTTIENLLNECNNYIMFRIVNNRVFVLNDSRRVLRPENKSINSRDVFTMYSKSVVQDLLSQGGGSDAYIEQRNGVLTVTYGNYTMEVGSICPPVCN
ncbi:MAG: hypothetical protein IH852_03360 [Bacteroidetes bacterium]|nr:hypothetical protein [Bacteroidota bacterium]